MNIVGGSECIIICNFDGKEVLAEKIMDFCVASEIKSGYFQSCAACNYKICALFSVKLFWKFVLFLCFLAVISEVYHPEEIALARLSEAFGPSSPAKFIDFANSASQTTNSILITFGVTLLAAILLWTNTRHLQEKTLTNKLLCGTICRVKNVCVMVQQLRFLKQKILFRKNEKKTSEKFWAHKFYKKPLTILIHHPLSIIIPSP